MLRPQDVAVIKDIKGEEDKGDRDLILKGEDGRARLPVGRTPGRAKHWGDYLCNCRKILSPMLRPQDVAVTKDYEGKLLRFPILKRYRHASLAISH